MWKKCDVPSNSKTISQNNPRKAVVILVVAGKAGLSGALGLWLVINLKALAKGAQKPCQALICLSVVGK